MPWIESAPHVDDARMRHISDADLLRAFDLDEPGLAAARGCLESNDLPGAVHALRVQLTGSDRRQIWEAEPWGSAAAGTDRAREFIDAANALLDADVDFVASRGVSATYGFHYLTWMRPLVEAYRITHDPAYAGGWDRLFGQWYASRDNVIGELPGLDVIWYSLGVGARCELSRAALATFGPESRLSDEVYAQGLKTILGGARWSAEEHTAFRHGNWQLGCVAELVLAAVAFPELRESSDWLTIGKARLTGHLDNAFYPDGGHHERSPEYHWICLDALQRAAAAGDRYLGWNLAAHPRFIAAHDWLVALANPRGWVPHLQDGEIVWPAVCLLRGWRLTGNRSWQTMARRWLTTQRLAEELASIAPDEGPPPADGPEAAPDPASTLLPTSKYAVMRTGWRRDDVVAVVNYGPTVGHELESHSHNAVLDFVISGWGVPLAWEAGGPASYDDPDYHDWYQATHGHNNVVLGRTSMRADRHCVLAFARFDSQVDAIAGHHSGYSHRIHRRIVLVRAEPAYFLITDIVAADPRSEDLPAEAEWILHGVSTWQKHPSGYVSSRGPGLLVVPADVEALDVGFSAGPARIPNPEEGTAHFGRIQSLRLRRRMVPGRELRYDVLLLPFESVPPDPVLLRREGDKIRINVRGVTDILTDSRWERTDLTTSRDFSTSLGQRHG